MADRHVTIYIYELDSPKLIDTIEFTVRGGQVYDIVWQMRLDDWLEARGLTMNDVDIESE